MAPHFTMREKYGGDVSDARFRDMALLPGLRTFERMAPFIPSAVVVEWNCNVDDAPAPSRVPLDADQAPRDAPHAKRADAVLEGVIGRAPDSARLHHRWEVRGLRRPAEADIVAHLEALPPLEQKEGLYDIFYRRHGSGEPLPDGGEHPGDPLRKSNKPLEGDTTAEEGEQGPTGSVPGPRKPAPKRPPSNGAAKKRKVAARQGNEVQAAGPSGTLAHDGLASILVPVSL